MKNLQRKILEGAIPRDVDSVRRDTLMDLESAAAYVEAAVVVLAAEPSIALRIK